VLSLRRVVSCGHVRREERKRVDGVLMWWDVRRVRDFVRWGFCWEIMQP
jgi:hypothetical protein